MAPAKRKPDPKRRAAFLAEVERNRATRQQGYREQALALFPHVCARCGREFSGQRLRELTVHHKDHNHLNNPADGSNWELLCLYCHDHEHENAAESGHYGALERHSEGSLGHNAFGALKDLLPPEQDGEGEGPRRE